MTLGRRDLKCLCLATLMPGMQFRSSNPPMGSHFGRCVSRRTWDARTIGECATFFFLAFLLAFAPPKEAASKPKRYALVIGINEYKGDNRILRLKHSENDAADISEILKTLKFDVVKTLDHSPTRSEILEEYYDILRLAKEEDEFVLYFSGHGVVDSQIEKTYWLTRNARLNHLEIDGIRLDEISWLASQIKARRKLIILDHCLSGDFDAVPINKPTLSDDTGTRTSGPTTTRPPPKITLNPIKFSPGSSASTSGHMEQVKGKIHTANLDILYQITAARDEAWESTRDLGASNKRYVELGNGFLTHHIIRAFEDRDADTNGDRQLSVRELGAYVESKENDKSGLDIEKYTDIKQDIEAKSMAGGEEPWILGGINWLITKNDTKRARDFINEWRNSGFVPDNLATHTVGHLKELDVVIDYHDGDPTNAPRIFDYARVKSKNRVRGLDCWSRPLFVYTAEVMTEWKINQKSPFPVDQKSFLGAPSIEDTIKSAVAEIMNVCVTEPGKISQ